MLVLELRDAGAGVLARSYKREDWTQFLRTCIARKHGEMHDLNGIDPFAIAVLAAEIERLKTICGLLDGTIAYVNVEDEDEAEATPGGSRATGDTLST
jgi:hypothetical protein